MTLDKFKVSAAADEAVIKEILDEGWYIDPDSTGDVVRIRGTGHGEEICVVTLRHEDKRVRFAIAQAICDANTAAAKPS